MITGQILNLIFIILMISLPFIIWNRISNKQKERKEQLDRIEGKIDQMEK